MTTMTVAEAIRKVEEIHRRGLKDKDRERRLAEEIKEKGWRPLSEEDFLPLRQGERVYR